MKYFLLAILALHAVVRANCLDPLLLSGIVMDAKTRNPVPNAQVTVVGRLAMHDETTDANGNFILRMTDTIKPGEIVRIRVKRQGYQTRDEQVSVSVGLPLQVILVPIDLPKSRGSKPLGERYPLTFQVLALENHYPKGTVAYGIAWAEDRSDTRIHMANPSLTDYTNLDLFVEVDREIAGMGQLTNFPDVHFIPDTGPIVDLTLVGTDENGKPIQFTPVLTGPFFTPKYRIHCSRILSKSNIETVLATVSFEKSTIGTPPTAAHLTGSYEVEGKRVSFDRILRVEPVGKIQGTPRISNARP